MAHCENCAGCKLVYALWTDILFFLILLACDIALVCVVLYLTDCDTNISIVKLHFQAVNIYIIMCIADDNYMQLIKCYILLSSCEF